MESLALLVTLIVLGRVLLVALWIALTVYALHYRFVDGILQARPGLPASPVFRFGLVLALALTALALVIHINMV